MTTKKARTVSMSDEAYDSLTEIAQELGLSRSAVLSLLINLAAKGPKMTIGQFTKEVFQEGIKAFSSKK